jgi:hypothetical protein
MRFGVKDGQRGAHPLVFYRPGVDWSSPENRVNEEASDLAVELDLGVLDLGRERALESLDRHWPSGLRVADELADVLLRDPPSRQKFDQVAVNWGRDKFLPPGATRYARHFDHLFV